MQSSPLLSRLPVRLPSAAREVAARGTVSEGPQAARAWFLVAIGSLVLSGLLSLTLVLGRLPGLGSLFPDPLFFRRALVVHVDLALVVWFQAGAAAFLAFGPARASAGRLAPWALVPALGGVAAMLLGAGVRGAQPVLANYVPVIDHPLFLGGIAAWFGGAAVFFGGSLRGVPAPHAAGVLLRAAAAAHVLAVAAFAGAWWTTPRTLPAGAYYELVFWGGGHVLQAANVALMLALWLRLLRRWSSREVLTPATARALAAALVLPHAALVAYAWAGTTTTAYTWVATQLMRWTLFPPVVFVLVAGLRHYWRQRADAPPGFDFRLAGLAGSATLTLLGFLLGAMIRGSSTLVPGHYHCAIGAVTLALMAAAYDLAAEIAPRGSAPAPAPRRARLQLLLFGGGQAVFGLGFALAGAYGLGRKQYAGEQHIRTLGEYLGLGAMGAGGLVAVAGGVLFLVAMLRCAHAWRRRAAPA